jgi:hypothetical protein
VDEVHADGPSRNGHSDGQKKDQTTIRSR